MRETLVDPRVSRAKFDREIARFREFEADYIRRGWWMLRAEFPEVFVVFACPKIRPPLVAFGALLDFSNYDLWPPSVKLVNPFTQVPYKATELPTPLPRRLPVPDSRASDSNDGTAPTSPIGADNRTTAPESVSPSEPQMQFLVQSFNPNDPEETPFLCLPGVREYHENPAHTGDSWLLHRGNGEGTLHFILDQLDRYGVQPLGIGFQIKVEAVPVLQIRANEVPL